MSTIKGFATGTVPQPAGTTALDTRKANAFAVVANSAGTPRTGVLGSNPSIVTTDASTAPMRVAVAKAGFVTSRSIGDGVINWGNDGSVFVTVTAPLSNRHIVVIYAKHNDAAAGDPTSAPVIEAVAGAASASPVKPAIPTGAEELATLDIPSTATSTESGGVVLTNTYKMTALYGGIVQLRDATEEAAWTPDDGAIAFRQDTEAPILRSSGAWKTLNNGLNLVHSSTFAAVSTVNLDDIFSALFDAYTIELDLYPIAAKSVIYARLRNAGVTNTGGGYYWQLHYGGGSSSLATGANSQNRWQLTTLSGDQATIKIELSDPATAIRTMGIGRSASWDSVVGPSLHVTHAALAHAVTSAFDGLAIATDGAPVMTGRVRVYGHYAA